MRFSQNGASRLDDALAFHIWHHDRGWDTTIEIWMERMVLRRRQLVSRRVIGREDEINEEDGTNDAGEESDGAW